MTHRPPTVGEAERFTAYMAATVGARIVTRTSAVEYQMLRAALQAVSGGVLDIEKLLETYSTAIGPLVYLSPQLEADPLRKCAIVTHECEHVTQFYRGDAFSFAWLYLTEGEARATYEAQAYASQMEAEVALTGKLPSLDELAWPLEGGVYQLSPAHIALARGILAARATAASHGVTGGLCGKLAVSWFEKHAPECIAPRG